MYRFVELALLSYPIVLLAVLPLWLEIRRREEFGKRPKLLRNSVLCMGAAGLLSLVAYLELLPKTGNWFIFLSGASAALYACSVILLEYSIHFQRIRDSFFEEETSNQFRKLFPPAMIILAAVLLAVVLEGLHLLFGMDQFVPTGLIAAALLLGLFWFAMLAYLELFQFQAGVIRRKTFTITAVGTVSLLAVFAAVAMGRQHFFVWFVIIHVVYLYRVFQEYFFARFIHLNDLFSKLQDTIRVRNELVDRIIHTPVHQDHTVVESMFQSAVEQTQREATLPQYSITGAAVYRRIGDDLVCESDDYTYGYCIPLYEIDTIRKLNREQLVNKIRDQKFNLRKLKTQSEDSSKQFGMSYMRSLVETREPVKIYDIPACFQGLVSFIAVYPVVDRENITGCVMVFKDSFHDLFPQEDRNLRTFANNLSTIFNIIDGKQKQEERNRLQGEMEIAKNIQTSIVPKEFSIPGYRIAASMETATEVGGDVYDWIPTEEGNYLAIGDVSGHGLPSGIMTLIQMASLHGAVRAASTLKKQLPVDSLYNIVNQVLCTINRDRIGSDKFMTGNYLFQKDGKIEHAGAHEIALLYSAKSKKVNEIRGMVQRTGYLGISEHVDASSSTGAVDMSDGDVLLLYTDGIIEAMDSKNEQFGIPRMSEVLLNNCDAEPEVIVEALREAVRNFALNGDLAKHDNHFSDDITLMVVKKTS
ncbi:PP2C family protein-serine/threonine phosphatase [Spirochaeta dissipatitropha]